MSFTLGGYPLIGGRVSMDLQGPWVATLNVDADVVLSGQLQLELPGTAFTCTVLPARLGGGIVEGVNWCRVVGGYGGLRKRVDGQHFSYSDARTIAETTLQLVGEVYSPASVDPLLFGTMEHWMRLEGTCGAALDALAAQLGLEWRVRPDGTTWFGQSTWEEELVPADVLRDHLQQGRLELACDDRTIMPGVTIYPQDTETLALDENSYRVRRAEHFLVDGTTWRTIVHYDAEAAA